MGDQLKDFYDSIIDSFDVTARIISVYYHAVGSKASCGQECQLFYPNPGMGIDWVPIEAREGLERLALESGLAVRRHDGSGGKEAYFSFPKEGLTAEKLDALGAAVEKEIERLKGPNFIRDDLLGRHVRPVPLVTYES